MPTNNILNFFYNGRNENNFKTIVNEKTSIDKKGGEFKNLNEETIFDALDCFINQNFSSLKSSKKIKFSNCESYNSYKQYFSKNQKARNLINLFFDEQIFNQKIIPIINELNTEEFELILYSYKICLSCSLSNNNSIYSKMISQNCMREIYDSYIPGAELFSDLFVESYYSIKKYIETSDKSSYGDGFYVCNCGEWYYTPPCGVPITISYCINCKKEIGGKNQILTKRGKEKYEKEIIRVYYNEKNKENVQNRNDLKKIYKDQWYDSILFEDFEKESKDKMNKDYKGIICNNYILFNQVKKTIRNLSEISYRILSYIIYSNILFSCILGYIKIEELKEKQLVPLEEKDFNGKISNKEIKEEGSKIIWAIDRMNKLKKRKENRNIKDIINMLKVNWELLIKALKKEKINDIHCFMNLIFESLNKLIKNSNSMKEPDERKKFEDQFNKIINENIKSFPNLSQNYLKVYKEYNNVYSHPILGYPPKDLYPYLFDILSIETVSKNGIKDFINSIENPNDYPVLINYLNTNEELIQYLQNINLMNDFILFTIENYSYQIDRETAKTIKMSSEVKKEEFPKESFKKFKLAFNEHKIYKKSLQYGCHPLIDKITIKKLDEKIDPLSSFLIDNGEYGHGMQIAAAYQDFISIQNTFLNNIKEKLKNKSNERIQHLIKKMEQKIPPQKAKKYNVIPFKILTENYNGFNELLLIYSFKDENGEMIYDLNNIENELMNFILPDKKLFDENQLYVIYQYESFREKNSNVIPEFCAKFPQIELNENEKMQLYDFRNNLNSNDSDKKLLFSIQILIFYLRENEEISEIKEVKDIINNESLPKYIHLSKETFNLFNSINFTLSKLLSIYEYFELLCYEDFKRNTNEDYFTPIPEDIKMKLNEYFEKKEVEGILISKTILSEAVRKFISRFLSGKRNQLDIEPEMELILFMKNREDIWKQEIRESVNFESELNEIENIQILVCNSINLYDFLGGDKYLLGDSVNREIQNEERQIERDN